MGPGRLDRSARPASRQLRHTAWSARLAQRAGGPASRCSSREATMASLPTIVTYPGLARPAPARSDPRGPDPAAPGLSHLRPRRSAVSRLAPRGGRPRSGASGATIFRWRPAARPGASAATSGTIAWAAASATRRGVARPAARLAAGGCRDAPPSALACGPPLRAQHGAPDEAGGAGVQRWPTAVRRAAMSSPRSPPTKPRAWRWPTGSSRTPTCAPPRRICSACMASSAGN